MARTQRDCQTATASQTDERKRRWLIANICPVVRAGKTFVFLRQLLGVRPEEATGWRKKALWNLTV